MGFNIEFTQEMCFYLQLLFYLALISRHFIGLTRYFRLWKVMPQIKEPVSNKFNKMEFKKNDFLVTLKAKYQNVHISYKQN